MVEDPVNQYQKL